MTFDLTLPGGIPALSISDGYAMADPLVDDYDYANIVYAAARARALAVPHGDILAELPAEYAATGATNGRDELADLYAMAERDKYLLTRCLYHDDGTGWKRVFTDKPITRSQSPAIPSEVRAAMWSSLWRVLEAAASPFD